MPHRRPFAIVASFMSMSPGGGGCASLDLKCRNGIIRTGDRRAPRSG